MAVRAPTDILEYAIDSLMLMWTVGPVRKRGVGLRWAVMIAFLLRATRVEFCTFWAR